MAGPLRPYGVLSDSGDCLYGYESLTDLAEATMGERDLERDEVLIRIDSYTVLAFGPGSSYPDPPAPDK